MGMLKHIFSTGGILCWVNLHVASVLVCMCVYVSMEEIGAWVGMTCYMAFSIPLSFVHQGHEAV